MKTKFKRWLFILGLMVPAAGAIAYPPAPHHTFQGMLRDEYGRPIPNEKVTVHFENSSGSVVTSKAGKIILPGVNYQIEVPMDAGTTRQLYNLSR